MVVAEWTACAQDFVHRYSERYRKRRVPVRTADRGRRDCEIRHVADDGDRCREQSGVFRLHGWKRILLGVHHGHRSERRNRQRGAGAVLCAEDHEDGVYRAYVVERLAVHHHAILVELLSHVVGNTTDGVLAHCNPQRFRLLHVADVVCLPERIAFCERCEIHDGGIHRVDVHMADWFQPCIGHRPRLGRIRRMDGDGRRLGLPHYLLQRAV